MKNHLQQWEYPARCCNTNWRPYITVAQFAYLPKAKQMKFISAVFLSCLLCFTVAGIYSCEKTSVKLEDNAASNDPDITYLEDMPVTMSTVKLDSFVTSGLEQFMIGTHNDTVFGKMSANSYAEIVLPATNSLNGTDVLFDSICIRLMPTGNYSGDTTLPIKINVHQLTKNIENDDAEDVFYQTKTVDFSGTPIASFSGQIKPTSKKIMSIRLPDSLGQNWMNKLRTNNYTFQSQERFRNYFKGVVLQTDSVVNKNIFYFNSDSNKVLIRLYYKNRGLTNIAGHIDFTFNSSKQFVQLAYNYNNTAFSLFHPTKKQELSSSLTGGRALMSSNNASYVKFSFPGILTLKELFPFVKVIKAELEIKPLEGSYRYPYALPATLLMNTGNTSNNVTGNLYDAATEELQTGNLVLDKLNNANTKYSFDVTEFINVLIDEGRFSERTLLLGQGSAAATKETQRLILNDQTVKKDVKLKLYVLGL
jgi:hypothetical protein